MKNALPAMHGSWSIWLASTLMGILNYFNLYGVVLSILLLLSIQPLHRFLREGVISPLLAFPALFMIAVASATGNNQVLLVLTPYALLFLLQILVKRHLRPYIVLGAIVLTLPFPLMAAMWGESPGNFLNLWSLLVLIALYSVLLADAVIFENGSNLGKLGNWGPISKRRIALLFIILATAMYQLSSPYFFPACHNSNAVYNSDGGQNLCEEAWSLTALPSAIFCLFELPELMRVIDG